MGLGSDKSRLQYCFLSYLLYNFSVPVWKWGNNSVIRMQVFLVDCSMLFKDPVKYVDISGEK